MIVYELILRKFAALVHCGLVAIVENCPDMPDWFLSKTDEMREYYMAIEFDPNMSREEKQPFMIEWWDKAHDLLVSTSLLRMNLAEAVRRSNLYLRSVSQTIPNLNHCIIHVYVWCIVYWCIVYCVLVYCVLVYCVLVYCVPL